MRESDEVRSGQEIMARGEREGEGSSGGVESISYDV